MRLIYALVICGTLSLSCSGSEGNPTKRPDSAALSVGDEAMSADLLRYVAENVGDFQALVRDALFAKESSFRNGDRTQVVFRSVMARALHERFAQDVLKESPPSPEELEQQRAANWLLFDRPRAVRTIDIRVPVEELAPEAPRLDLAHTLRDLARSAHNVEQLAQLVRSHETDLEVQLFRIPPVSESGRVVPTNPQDRERVYFDSAFGKAAAPLSSINEVSEVFATEDAFHVLFAVEIIEGHRPDTEIAYDQLRRGLAAARVAPRISELKREGQKSAVRTRVDLAPLLSRVWQK